MVHEKILDVNIKSYKSPKGENTKINEEIKDLGVEVLLTSSLRNTENITNAGSTKCRQRLRSV